jgi:UDP-glucose 4-epimerase
MHYLITGGAGFIGSHLVEHLLGSGHSVTVLDNFSTGCRSNLPNHEKLRVVADDLLTCAHSLPDGLAVTFDGIAHLAAIPSVQESWATPRRAHDANLTAMMSVLELRKRLKIPRLVLASSAAVYGNPVSLPIAEIHPTEPMSPYGLQKLASERYGYLFAAKERFSFAALRLFNVYGPRQRGDSPYSGAISKFICAMQNQQAIEIFGDGSQTRDFVYVKDAARAFEAALTTQAQGTAITCNVATGCAVSIRELFEGLREFFPDWKQEPHYVPTLEGDIRQSQADPSAARSILGFRSSYSLADGLAELVQAMSAPGVVSGSMA